MGFFAAGNASIETTYAHPGDGGEDRTILDRLLQLVDDTPAGGEIRATIFRLNLSFLRDALVAANNRGVRVHVMHNGLDQGNEVALGLARAVPDGLGDRHRWSGRPYDPTDVMHDYGAVATGQRSDLHTKLMLFSATKDPRGVLRDHVSWWGSANMSLRSGMQKSNNAVTVYGDEFLYHGFREQLWDLMWAGWHPPGNDFYNGSLGRGTFMGSRALRAKVFCSPEQTTDLWVGRLASVVVDERTRVDVAQGRFLDARRAVARELARIAAAGGTVRVVADADPDMLGPRVRRILLDAGIAVRTAVIHDKVVLVHSCYGSSTTPRKVAFTGSHNLNHDANYVNDEILVKMFHDEMYDDLLAEHFEHIWSTGRPVTDTIDDGEAVQP